MTRSQLLATVLALAFLGACTDGSPVATPTTATGYKGSLGKSDSSAEAVFVDFEFDGELLTSHCWDSRNKIQDQLLYTIGQLNGERGVGRLDRLDLTDIKTEMVDSKCRINYHARMPVAWGKRGSVPDTYELLMPHDVTFAGQEAFTKAYSHDCVDFGAHDVDSGSMWYYYRPHQSRCSIDDDDIVRLVARVSLSPIGTTGKYPEYHKVWEDDQLRVVAVFGKYEDGATTGDAGINAYNTFIRSITDELGADVTTTPAEVPASPGVALPDITFEARLPDGKRVSVTSLLVDNVRTAGRDFDQRYGELSRRADLIVYGGHAGLGANIRAMARKGEWVEGQYAIVFMNGCDTYAYIDSALVEAYAAVNPDDPEGTKHVDILANALPSFFRSMSGAAMALVRGLMNYEEPRTYEQIFGGIDSSEVVLVTGEHDNVYVPGFGEDIDQPDPDPAWAGLDEAGVLARDEEARFATPTLPAGAYRFVMSGSGDADLYVRLGDAPGLELFDCRPYMYGSDEVCEVTLSSPTAVHLMVTGWAASSDYQLSGRAVTE